ncbi:hydroxyethylthiazole kinase [Campylobacter pinnipediorum subsp. caledonicus]|uniref:Hydroxyethylthiazole kinase n=1 Tax=Campylobacter pinnipediorum subsp. caledonicus TaxID=1874362 RepID=A0A1S6U5A4_9BACT|nr:hydroxyethylthiazole kinase [Campylobacter pinnipediorum]AQW86958.1 hydroxyethylthiazole kinase [Campylobacter pinnipediorum subsp. caledonicus]
MEILSQIRSLKPLVHCITNYVTANDVANALISLGASPVMADDEREVEEMVCMSNALVINIGTLNERTITSMIKAGKKANGLNIPVVLDPVGAGATTFRTQTALKLIENIKFSIIRGNASEISALVGDDINKSRGVDVNSKSAELGVEEMVKRASVLWKLSKSVVVVSGRIDIVLEGNNVAVGENGHEIMTKVTGSGCMLSAVLAAFAASEEDIFQAALYGVLAFGICGEMAMDLMSDRDANASYRNYLINELSNIDDSTIELRKMVRSNLEK